MVFVYVSQTNRCNPEEYKVSTGMGWVDFSMPLKYSCHRRAPFSFYFVLLFSAQCYTIRYLDTGVYLQLVTVDFKTGNVFAGGTNFVFIFEKYLSHIINSTKICSQLCISENEARILEVIPNSSSLLLCGTGQNGLCSMVDMNTLNVTELNSLNSLNYAGAKDSVFGFFSKDQFNSVLYVGRSLDKRPQNISADTISSRIVERPSESELFDLRYDYVYENLEAMSAFKVSPSQRMNYDVRYIYGFEHQGFAYFVIQQRDPSEYTYQTKLVRVCQRDLGFFSYTELVLTCRKYGSVFERYNVPLAAYVTTPGLELQVKFKLSPSEALLFVIFGQSDHSSSFANQNHGSVLCMYRMADIRKEFTAVQVRCYRGSGHLLWWLNPHEPRCNANLDIAKDISDDFGGTAENVGIAGTYPFQEYANFTMNAYLASSLRLIHVHNKTVAVVGTTTGLLLKVIIDGFDNAPYAVMNVGAGSAIRSDTEVDEAEENIYVLSGKRISVVPLKSCSIYSDCSSCIMTADPLNCGWCNNHCSTKLECTKHNWFHGYCPPAIHSFSPRSGPVEGGTLVVIYGENFGNGTVSESEANVKVGNGFECLIEHRNSSCIICRTKPSTGPLDRELHVWVKDKTKTTVPFEIHGNFVPTDDSFSYKIASVTKVVPVIGPVSGGTKVTISGSHLDIGSDLTISVVGRPCLVSSVTAVKIVCQTSPYDGLKFSRRILSDSNSGFVRVTIDSAALTRDRFKFSYSEDPVISDIFPNHSILSGGLNLTIIGTNLNCIQKPELILNVLNGAATYNSSCHPGNDGLHMICPAPNLKNESVQFAPTQMLVAELRFVMDKVKELWDFPATQPNLSLLTYAEDPEIFPHADNETLEMLGSDCLALRLKGQNLNLSASKSDYVVSAEGRRCDIVKLTMDELMCCLDKFHSLHRKEILVTVGNLNFVPGQLFLKEEALHQPEYFSVAMPVLLLSASASIVCIVVCLLWLKLRHKKLYRRKPQTIPNVLYLAGSQADLGSSRTGETLAGWHNPITNSYMSHSGPSEQRTFRRAGQRMTVTAREPAMDDESLRLLNDFRLLISRDDLHLLEIIGQGHFGCVFRGLLKDSVKGEMEVAVKTLKSASSFSESVCLNPVESKKFLEEALTMREFDHVHVLKLIGIVMDKEEWPLVVLPFMRHGDLLSYIRNDSNSPTVRDLMVFGMQVADGMDYLANLKFVHRDLAARNCMLDNDMLVKIADFGLSRDIYERDYYSSDDRKAKLPVKWMALESLEKGIYNTKTDVWSFGVVLWELMTRGISPYPDVDNWDIVRYLRSGRRMLQPSYCPNSLYNLMLDCWSLDHSQRPTFRELASAVRNIICRMEDGQQLTVGLNITYINSDIREPNYLHPMDSWSAEPPVSHSYVNRRTNYLSLVSSQSTLV